MRVDARRVICRYRARPPARGVTTRARELARLIAGFRPPPSRYPARLTVDVSMALCHKKFFTPAAAGLKFFFSGC
jgi:hypothetical protein